VRIVGGWQMQFCGASQHGERSSLGIRLARLLAQEHPCVVNPPADEARLRYASGLRVPGSAHCLVVERKIEGPDLGPTVRFADADVAQLAVLSVVADHNAPVAAASVRTAADEHGPSCVDLCTNLV